MRVIREPKIREAEITCWHCKAELAYLDSDIKQATVQKHGEWYLQKYVVCPVCNHGTTVSYTNEYEIMLGQK